MTGLLRQGHFLGSRLRSLRRRNGLTLEDLSARCVQLDAALAPSVSYLSMVETGKRIPSAAMLGVLATVFGKSTDWFLDRESVASSVEEPAPAGRGRSGLPVMPLEPGFLFSRELLQLALPELLAQTGTSGTQFARLLVRVWQETRQNDFPDIERAAESAGRRRMPLSLQEVLEIAAQTGLTIRWADDERSAGARLLRARYEPPGDVVINSRLQSQSERR